MSVRPDGHPVCAHKFLLKCEVPSLTIFIAEDLPENPRNHRPYQESTVDRAKSGAQTTDARPRRYQRM